MKNAIDIFADNAKDMVEGALISTIANTRPRLTPMIDEHYQARGMIEEVNVGDAETGWKLKVSISSILTAGLAAKLPG